jgi:DNA-binding CsgD family transcriptional regulator
MAQQDVSLAMTAGLRPGERRVLRWAETGLDDAEIGHRFGRGEQWAAQVRRLARVPRSGRAAPDAGGLRPMERRVLRWREHGANYADLSGRFRRRSDFARVEMYLLGTVGVIACGRSQVVA